MAMGTIRGKVSIQSGQCHYLSSSAQVLVYDLRSPKTPTKAVIAHNTSVTSMVFKHKVDRQQVAQVMSVVKTRPKMLQH